MSWLKDYFSFSKRERNAFIGLVVIIGGFIILPDFFSPGKAPAKLSDEIKKQLADSKSQGQKDTEENQAWQTPFAEPDQKKAIRLFEFDPNTLDEEGFVRLGLPERTARTIINYRSKGGKFRKPDDLRKIYSLKKADADRIIPFAKIISNEPYSQPYFKKNETVNPPPAIAVKLFEFDPNTLDEAGFITLGLTERTARTIINYRNKGGRFRNAEDLRKIYSLPKEDADRIIPYAKIAPDITGKASDRSPQYQPKSPIIIDINTATAEEWKSLPGIGEILSARIVKFRESLGGFSSVEQVAKTYGLKDSTFQLIRPYLRFSPAGNQPQKQ